MSRSPRVELDGSMGEGGGQIVRTALSFAAIYGTPVRIVNVRSRRDRPGLQPQHLAAVRAAAQICGARLSGAERGSTELVFEPTAPVQPGAYRFDIGTAGSAPLVVQTILLPLAIARGASSVVVTGGTHVPHAPPAECVADPYVLALSAMGVAVAVRCVVPGFYPRGGGEVRIETAGFSEPFPIAWECRGGLKAVRAYVVTAGLPEHVSVRGVAAVRARLRSVPCVVDVVVRAEPSGAPGAVVVIVAQCERGAAGSSALGERGVPMERVAEDACAGLLQWFGNNCSCDARLADQLVLPAALAPGESCWTTPSVTTHLRTVLAVAAAMAGADWTITERSDGSATVRVRGVGIPRSQ